jgi:adenosylhomocysteine nucleosidase
VSLAADAVSSLPAEGPAPLAILAALRREISPLVARARILRRWRAGSLRASFGFLDQVEVILASTGDGAENASRGAEALLDSHRVRGVVIVGVSGALSPGLRRGRLLVGRQVLDETGIAPGPDPGWIQQVLRSTQALPATLFTSPRVLSTPESKARAFGRFPRGTVAGVDLETGAFARAAARRSIPYVALRAISDTADEALPLDFDALRDASGGVDVRRVALRALFRPALLPPLWSLRGNIALCSENLAAAVQALLKEGAL